MMTLLRLVLTAALFLALLLVMGSSGDYDGPSRQEAGTYVRCETVEALIDIAEEHQAVIDEMGDPEFADLVVHYYVGLVEGCGSTGYEMEVDDFMPTGQSFQGREIVRMWLLEEGPRYAFLEDVLETFQ